MTVSLADVAFLASDAGAVLLARLASDDWRESDSLRVLTALRRDYPPEHARAGLEMTVLRRKAADKFGADAKQLFFTREALEQASHPYTRHYRAAKLRDEFHVHHVVDACCSIGADAQTFAQAGLQVHGFDLDAVRVAIAEHNAALLGLSVAYQVADVRDGLPQADAVFFDPARRDDDGNRLFDVEHYQPPLSTIRAWLGRYGCVAVKLAPGVDLQQLRAYGGEVEFISVEGELKEAVLWCDGGASRSTATLLVGDGVGGYRVLRWGEEPHPQTPLPRTGEPDSPSLPEMGAGGELWLCEPDPALLRTGLVQDVARHFGGAQLDSTIAYFMTSTRPNSPWVRAWKVRDEMPFNLKRLRAYLRERNIGTVTVKKRGFPMQPDELIPQLKLKGEQSCTLVCTRREGQPVVLVCADYHTP